MHSFSELGTEVNTCFSIYTVHNTLIPTVLSTILHG